MGFLLKPELDVLEKLASLPASLIVVTLPRLLTPVPRHFFAGGRSSL